MCTHLKINALYNPALSSAQLLADGATAYGTELQRRDDTAWVGLPLRVHRRCGDPMFGIANHIAYDGLMVRPKHDASFHTPLGDSAWFDVPGLAGEENWVPAQGALVAKLVSIAFAAEAQPPSLVVISPFKSVQMAMQRVLIKTLPGAQAHAWVKRSVGTVHTFQGKEADCVILLLGANAQRVGAMRWASAKPNLLNVAVTRAKQRLYVVGDRGLWGTYTYFDILRRKVPLADSARLASLALRPTG